VRSDLGGSSRAAMLREAAALVRFDDHLDLGRGLLLRPERKESDALAHPL